MIDAEPAATNVMIEIDLKGPNRRVGYRFAHKECAVP
jgi:hypothetical protein